MAIVFPGAYWPGRFWPTDYWPEAADAPPEPEPTLLPDVGWVNGLYALILVGRPDGTIIGELQAELGPVSWVLNEAGQTRLVVATATARDYLIAFGNRVLIHFDNGLPPWVGYVETPRRWRQGSVELTLAGGEALLAYRVVVSRVFAAATPGSMFAALLAAQAGPPVVGRGQIDTGGTPVAAEFHYQTLLDAIENGVLRYGGDWSVSGAVEGGRIRLRANYYARRGRQRTGVRLVEGRNIATAEPEEQGPLVNEWLMAGAGTGWGVAARPYAAARDSSSAGRYGLRQGAQVVADARDAATLATTAAATLAATAEPYVAITLRAVNLTPARFADYDVGDVVGVELPGFPGHFDEQRRVIGREFQPRDGVCEVVVV